MIGTTDAHKGAAREGDMVVYVPTGRVIGLLTCARDTVCTVMVANSIIISGWKLTNLRQATPDEIDASHYRGVGCNEYRGNAPFTERP